MGKDSLLAMAIATSTISAAAATLAWVAKQKSENKATKEELMKAYDDLIKAEETKNKEIKNILEKIS